ncbi:MAG TPA: cytochrome c peroxidase [Polyangia bacterium]|jgi:cytochrome c peroxidase|nr:cytochrome c peroxidase [Polyangia bacterium]
MGWRVPAAVLAIGLLGGCGKGWGGHCASGDDCFFSGDEWTLVSSLANVAASPPPADPSNEFLDPTQWDAVQSATDPADLPAIVRLGWRLYYDPRLSGDGADPKDSYSCPAPAPRLPGATTPELGISCATCHDPAHYGSDFTSQPSNVSNGAGWYDVNAQQTLNVARFFPVFYWNGRADALWSQAAQVMESSVSMNSRREKTLYLVAQCYLGDDDYQAVFGDLTSLNADVSQMGSYMAVPSASTAKTAAFRTAYDDARLCHPELPQTLAARVHANVAKAIGAYEWFLTSDRSRFDAFVNAGPASHVLNPSEKRGLKLFIGHAGCVNCHNSSLFSDRQFHDIGIGQAGNHVPTVPACETPGCDCRLPDAIADGGAGDAQVDSTATGAPAGVATGGACLPVGAFAGMQKLHAASSATSPSATTTFRQCPSTSAPSIPATTIFRRCTCLDNEFYLAHKADCDSGATIGDLHGCADEGPATYDDAGGAKPPARWLGAWRTPSLRDVAMTGPYMHDGSYATLADVVWHYDQALSDVSRDWGTSELAPLNLSDQDRTDLVAFLGTLTGRPGPSVLIGPPADTYAPTCLNGAAPASATLACPTDAGADATIDANGDGL